MYLMNLLPIALPTPVAFTYDEEQERADLEFRATIRSGSGSRDGQRPLTIDEQKKLRSLKGKLHLSQSPKWNGLEFRFAPAGQKGCAWELPDDVALFLASNYNTAGSPLVCDRPGEEILHALRFDEELPEGIEALRAPLDNPLKFSSEAILSRGSYVSRGAGAPVLSQAQLDNLRPGTESDVRAAVKGIDPRTQPGIATAKEMLSSPRA